VDSRKINERKSSDIPDEPSILTMHYTHPKRLCLVLLMTAIMVLPAMPQPADPPSESYIVVGRDLQTRSLSQRELADILLGYRRRWANGDRVKVALLAAPEAQESFLRAITGRSRGQFWAHWRNIVFSGRGIMPRALDSQKEVLAYVEAEGGSLGQISNTNLVAGFAVLLVHVGQKGSP
jgi:hypothetical protein